jgi:hypothetical protein
MTSIEVAMDEKGDSNNSDLLQKKLVRKKKK